MSYNVITVKSALIVTITIPSLSVQYKNCRLNNFETLDYHMAGYGYTLRRMLSEAKDFKDFFRLVNVTTRQIVKFMTFINYFKQTGVTNLIIFYHLSA